jgi:hypothetical protein
LLPAAPVTVNCIWLSPETFPQLTVVGGAERGGAGFGLLIW